MSLSAGGGTLSGGSGGELPVDRAINTIASVLYDAVVVACRPDSVSTLAVDGYAVHFVTEAYKHLKPVGAFGAGIDLLRKVGVDGQQADGEDVVDAKGVVSTTAAEDSMPNEFFSTFAKKLAQHRVWNRDADSEPHERWADGTRPLTDISPALDRASAEPARAHHQTQDLVRVHWEESRATTSPLNAESEG